MKKFLTTLICVVLATLTLVGFTACNKADPQPDPDPDTDQTSSEPVSVYMPDGAPALAFAEMMSSDAEIGGVKFEYNVVDASLIQTYVTGKNPAADVCVLPVNLACKLLGTGENYKMLGTVTHGNLYILKKANGEEITLNNLNSLKGKTVGVVSLAAIPGLTFKLILNDNNVEYNELGNGGAKDSDKVNLIAVDAESGVIPSNETCDYFVVAEPAATTKVNATKGALSFAGDLQSLYGEKGGYPQAVLVAKNSLIESKPALVTALKASLTSNAAWLLNESTTAETIVSAVTSHLTEGMSPKFTANNLNKQVIEHCAIKFVGSADCKDEVKTFINKLIAVQASASVAPADTFFYV